MESIRGFSGLAALLALLGAAGCGRCERVETHLDDRCTFSGTGADDHTLSVSASGVPSCRF